MWGTFKSSSVKNFIQKGGNVLLVGGGAGCAYLLDSLFWLNDHKLARQFANIKISENSNLYSLQQI